MAGQAQIAMQIATGKFHLTVDPFPGDNALISQPERGAFF